MSTTHWGGDAEEIRLEPDENGWELVVETNSGTYRFNAHAMASSGDLAAMMDACTGQLDNWLAEGQRAAREHAVDLAKRETDEAYDRMVGDA